MWSFPRDYCCSLVTKSLFDFFATPWTVALQAPLSIEFPRQEYWSGLWFPSSRASSLPSNRTHFSCIAGGFLITEPPGSPSHPILCSPVWSVFCLFYLCLSHGLLFLTLWNWKYLYNLKSVLIRKNWCFWTMVLEKTLESPLSCKEIQPVHPKGNQSWVFIGRTDVEAETPVLWPPHVKSWLIWKDPDAGKDWGQEEKGTTEDEMAGWHHWLDGHEFEWTPGVGDGQGVLACCSSGGHKESDMTGRLNWTEWGLQVSLI